MSTRSFSVGKPKLQTALLKYEAFPDYNRESMPLLAGDGADRIIEIGTLLGLTTATAVTEAAHAGNTGNGILTLANPAISDLAVPGVYQVIMLEAVADGGRFEVFNPDGVAIGSGVVGTAFTGIVKFTIADGAADFKANDSFAITVPNDATKLKEWDPTALDGSQVVNSIAIQKAVAADGVDNTVLVLARGPALIVTDAIEWPDGVTDQQKATALATLAANGIVGRLS